MKFTHITIYDFFSSNGHVLYVKSTMNYVRHFASIYNIYSCVILEEKNN